MTATRNGIPVAWVARMRESMARLTPRFSANRAVCEYAEKHYIPAAAAYRARAADKGAVGKQVVDWQQALEQRVGLSCSSESCGSKPTRTTIMLEVELFLGDLDPNSVRVELYAEGINGGAPVRQEMKQAQTRSASVRPRLSRTRCPRRAQLRTTRRE